MIRFQLDSVLQHLILLGNLFAESEIATCIKLLKSYDPNFEIETFLKLSRDLLIPNIIEAILCRDLPSLKAMCSEAVIYNYLHV